MQVHTRQLVIVLLAAALPMVGCATEQRTRVETTLARTLISDEQSNQIGEQVHADVARSGVRYVDDPRVLGYVDSVGERIFAVARRDRPGVEYHIHVIDDPKTVNAFAAPGGHLFVYSGLLLAAGNEAEVAAVLAHETGHVVGRHVERAIVNAYGLQALTAAAVGRNPSPAQEIAAGIAGTGLMRAHSRGEETEADEYGVRALSGLGYDPRAMITFFEKLRAGEGRTPGALKWLSTHPLTPDRIAHLENYIASHDLRGDELGTQRLAAIKSRLSTTS
ncbi:MAG TPA: M48 family metallopeptidase [Candidatus Polarisedimenticolia bacterium]|nr:M48 family metallopeptidase [Candidatus Polarisedimenticolia bacterium]